MNQDDGDWPREWTTAVGKAVRSLRRERGLSAAALSEKCAGLGYAIPRNTIANLEGGRKATLPVHELVVLARALGTSPVYLLAPVGIVDTVEITPNDARPTLEAAQWFSGVWVWLEKSPLAVHGSYLRALERTGVVPKDGVLDYWRRHQALIEAYVTHVDRGCEFLVNVEDMDRGLRPAVELFGAPQESREVWEERSKAAFAQATEMARMLSELRHTMDQIGLPLPPIGAELAYSLTSEWDAQGVDGMLSRPWGMRVEGEPVEQHPEAD